jgi:nitrite reductase/ring-hydroxylating ferredoxin subunit
LTLEQISREEVLVGTIDEIPDGGMKHVEINGKEIMVGNWEGNYYAISDRCGHMNARLSSGTLRGKEVNCGLHGAKYDITTGKNLSNPQTGGASSMLKQLSLPENFQKAMERQSKLGAEIKTYDVERYDVVVKEDRLLLVL